MAQLTIDIPNASVSRINTAFAAVYQYDPSSGLTQTQFTKQQIIGLIKQTVKAYEGGASAQAARDTVYSEVDAINIT